jgi:hypothetical protein
VFTRGPRTVGGPEVRVLPDMRAMFSPNLMMLMDSHPQIGYGRLCLIWSVIQL